MKTGCTTMTAPTGPIDPLPGRYRPMGNQQQAKQQAKQRVKKA
jgi:hypothetical protein